MMSSEAYDQSDDASASGAHYASRMWHERNMLRHLLRRSFCSKVGARFFFMLMEHCPDTRGHPHSVIVVTTRIRLVVNLAATSPVPVRFSMGDVQGLPRFEAHVECGSCAGHISAGEERLLSRFIAILRRTSKPVNAKDATGRPSTFPDAGLALICHVCGQVTARKSTQRATPGEPTLEAQSQLPKIFARVLGFFHGRRLT